MSNTKRRSGEAYAPKLERCASPHGWLRRPGVGGGVEVRGHDQCCASVERELRHQHPAMSNRHQFGLARPPGSKDDGVLAVIADRSAVWATGHSSPCERASTCSKSSTAHPARPRNRRCRALLDRRGLGRPRLRPRASTRWRRKVRRRSRKSCPASVSGSNWYSWPSCACPNTPTRPLDEAADGLGVTGGRRTRSVEPARVSGTSDLVVAGLDRPVLSASCPANHPFRVRRVTPVRWTLSVHALATRMPGKGPDPTEAVILQAEPRSEER
jgi:hypothetical protein